MLVTSRWIAGVEGDDAGVLGLQALRSSAAASVTGQRSNRTEGKPSIQFH
jgi:hypothetical protein